MNTLDHLFLILLAMAIAASNDREQKGALGLMIVIWSVEVVFYTATKYLI